jgi:hypothetical protein
MAAPTRRFEGDVMRVVARSFRCAAAGLALAAGAVAVPADAFADTPVPCDATALVDAVTSANLAGGGRLVLAASCTYTLTTAGGAGAGASGLPVITTPITLAGTDTTITRDPSAPQFRIAEVDGPAQQAGADGRLTVESTTLSGGDAGFGVGGAIANLGGGTVTLRGARVTGNHAAYGGGLYNDGALSLFVGLVSGNTADIEGGGVYNGSGTVVRRATGVAGNTPDNCAPAGSVTGGCPG